MKCRYCDGTGEHINDANRMTTCEFCGGTGEVEVVGDSVTDVCDKCGGTGEIEVTNEEWFCGLNTEEKADFFCTVQHCLTIYGDHIATIEDWEAWLKEKHNA